jgi:hypothetical protein
MLSGWRALLPLWYDHVILWLTIWREALVASFVSQQRNGVTRRMRLKGHDYSEPGMYFLTLTGEGGRLLFGHALDGVLIHTPAGDMVRGEWMSLSERFSGISWDVFCVMPTTFTPLSVSGLESMTILRPHPSRRLCRRSSHALQFSMAGE